MIFYEKFVVEWCLKLVLLSKECTFLYKKFFVLVLTTGYLIIFLLFCIMVIYCKERGWKVDFLIKIVFKVLRKLFFLLQKEFILNNSKTIRNTDFCHRVFSIEIRPPIWGSRVGSWTMSTLYYFLKLFNYSYNYFLLVFKNCNLY